jgi:small conductance mechanosensitive channel
VIKLISIFGFEIHEKVIYTLLTLAIGYLIYKLLLYLVNKSFTLRMRRFKVDERRQKTTNIIINNIIKYTFGVIIIFTLLGIFGVNAGAIVASIGVVGLAIGLAIQDTLKDVISGIFILVENQFAIGDIVMIGSFKGEVIFLGLKSTKLRSETGEIRILSNRNILEITNYSLEKTATYIDINLAYDNDVSVVNKMFDSVSLKLSKDTKCVIKYMGIANVADKITYRIRVEVDAKHQEELKAMILADIKESIDSNEVRR